jgi:hypothetical protein
MTAGRALPDLGRIETGRWAAECNAYACGWVLPGEAFRVKAVVRTGARRHAAVTGHIVIMYARVSQTVAPPPVHGAGSAARP